jgi:hypothetical protein
MNKSLKLLSRLSWGLWAAGLTSTDAFSAIAVETKPPATPDTSAPPVVMLSPTYSFFQGLTFAPFPGTIPRPAFGSGTSTPPIFPLVEVTTPGLIATQGSGPVPVIKKKKKLVVPAVELPVRRRRRVIPQNN